MKERKLAASLYRAKIIAGHFQRRSTPFCANLGRVRGHWELTSRYPIYFQTPRDKRTTFREERPTYGAGVASGFPFSTR
jgi:hypothetical protein